MRRILLMSEAEVAYVAGIIDGEGCIMITPHSPANSYSFACFLQITNADRRLIDKMSELTGVGHITEHKDKCRTRPLYRWHVRKNKDLVDLLKRVYPHSAIKKEQIELVCKMMAASHNGKRVTPEMYNYRKKLWERMKELHARHSTKNGGEFGESLSEITPSQASDEEGVEVSPEITDISAAPDREEMTRTAKQFVEL